ncbi:MAG: serine/threonine protein kinase, partial [Planctomycetaceae bacterium]|nr:serine/threonine protein kinase [Planctomycetaceae bacterium]
MNPRDGNSQQPSMESRRKLEVLCDDFERDWTTDRCQRIETILQAVEPELRGALLHELLLIEIERRRKLGETPRADEYRERLDEHTDVIRCVFEFAGDNSAEFMETLPLVAESSVLPDEGTKLGDYEILSELGRGGMGVVYRARQVSLNRIVALKVIREAGSDTEELVRRFQTEAEAAASLHHPGIVPVFEVGNDACCHYFSMELVDGVGLSEQVKRSRFAAADAVQLTQQIAAAIAYAHGKGVIHRDLKPGNILVNHAGVVKVADFGLARNLKSDSGLTLSGQVVGTPGYMPPEQAE